MIPQMVAAMQAQQQKLLESSSHQVSKSNKITVNYHNVNINNNILNKLEMTNNNHQQVNNNNLPTVKDLLSPLRQGAVPRLKQDQVRHIPIY